ncbi:DUF397 domain-containing protein [Lentzea tibetensis]|uniref:DUF397 domain-containing protein n=1 Tax=Lentzea tibetensis TaxID=2591470 RepID=A0A563EJF1_9PSEU|nr:DUF397 domain-containing protein [Lentzea tibetensis]TWP46158.1 DUF397 domain-containing protein [Lentzea tibetensis]
MESLNWRKSTRSSAAGPDCVEIAMITAGAAVRDSKNAFGGRLDFGTPGWTSFLSAAKSGDFVAR